MLPEYKIPPDKHIKYRTHADSYMIVPKGEKVLLWISHMNDKNACRVMTLNSQNKVIRTSINPMCFDNELALGTLIYGTRFNKKYVSCEDIFYYKGEKVEHYSLDEKFKLYRNMFDNHIGQIGYNEHFIILGMPVWTKRYQETMQELPYFVYSIRLYSKGVYVGTYQLKSSEAPTAIFRVKASTQDDIYNLYCHKANNSCGIASIPSYKRSVEMNNIFRIIKENQNLDFLEESDDEAEFQDVRIDKYVDLKKCVTMKCIYRKKIKKWEPLELSNGRIITEKEYVKICG